MINFYNQVPTIYSAASRDFQYLSWLINIVLNSVKHNVDDLYNLPNNKADPRLAELLAFTLGFKIRRNYDHEQLTALVSIIPSILKCKGTERAIILAGQALLKASGAIGSFKATINNNQIEIILPKSLIDITLFMDLLPYIAPAGMTCKIIRKTELDETFKTKITYHDLVYAKWHRDLCNDDTNKSIGLTGLFEGQTIPPTFTNYFEEKLEDGKTAAKLLNAGLLTNTVIPVLEEPIYENGKHPIEIKHTLSVSEIEQLTVSSLENNKVEEIESNE